MVYCNLNKYIVGVCARACVRVFICIAYVVYAYIIVYFMLFIRCVLHYDVYVCASSTPKHIPMFVLNILVRPT